MSRTLRRLSFWILVSDTMRFGWDDRAIRPSFGARFSIFSPRAEQSPGSRTILTSASRRPTELGTDQLIPTTSGTRSQMVALERWLVERDPSPLNEGPDPVARAPCCSPGLTGTVVASGA